MSKVNIHILAMNGKLQKLRQELTINKNRINEKTWVSNI